MAQSSRTRTGHRARALVEAWFEKNNFGNPHRLIEHLQQHGFEIVTQPYAKPENRGKARAATARAT